MKNLKKKKKKKKKNKKKTHTHTLHVQQGKILTRVGRVVFAMFLLGDDRKKENHKNSQFKHFKTILN